jgi:hypothetical protein
MPLREGGSQEAISANIGECMRSYRRRGKIGEIRPRDAAHAHEICKGMAYSKARASGARIPRPRGTTRRGKRKGKKHR